jgi:YVTN family beta-propeller protein
MPNTVEIYSTDTDSGVISVVRVKEGGGHERVTQVPVGNAPRGSVKFTGNGRGFVCNCGGDTISEIDVLTHRETTRIKVGPAPRGLGIVPGDRFALVSNSGANTISVVDLTSRREVAQVAVGRDPRHMYVKPDGSAAYVAIWGGHYIAKLDISALASEAMDSAAVGKVAEVARIPVGDEVHPYSVAPQPGSSRLWVANTQGTSATIIDTATDEVVGQVDLGTRGARAIAFSPAGDVAFITIENTSEVAVVETATETVTSRFPVGPGPRGLALDVQSETLYVTAFSRTTLGGNFTDEPPPPDTLTVVNVQPTIAARGNSGERPVNPRLSFVGVGKGSCAVSVIDTSKLQLGRR